MAIEKTPAVSLSPELYTRITSFITPPGRWIQSSTAKKTLASLSLTCKGFNLAACASLYSYGLCGSIQNVGKACRTIKVAPERGYGPLVKMVYIYPPSNDEASSSNRRSELIPNTYYAIFQEALEDMPNLDSLFFYGSGDSTETWVFNPGNPFPFQLSQLRFNQMWDQNVAEFISTQTHLQHIVHCPNWEKLPDHVQNIMPILPLAALPQLLIYDGPLVSALDLVNARIEEEEEEDMEEVYPPRPIECLSLDAEAHPQHYLQIYNQRPLLSYFKSLKNTLRSLRLHNVHPEYTNLIMPLLSEICPRVRKLGIIPWNPVTRIPFLKSLSNLRKLTTIELDISDLTLPKLHNPPYHITRTQYWQFAVEERTKRYTPCLRAIASELRIYNTSITQVVFWNAKGQGLEHGYEEKYVLHCTATESMEPEDRRYWNVFNREDGFMDWFPDIEFDKRRRLDGNWMYE